MKTFSTITYRTKSPSVVALGCFDGVHIGHSEVILTAKKKAVELGCNCTVWTFEEPPKNYFLPKAVPLITTKAEKCELIKALGVDTFICVPFTKETAKISAEDFFVNIIKERLCAVHVVCGFNYSFGEGGRGTVELLQKLCKEYGIGLTVLDAVSSGELTVSSSVIREVLERGDAEMATRLLGRPYSLKTVVIGGQHLARKLGFPTLNQEFPSRLAVPKRGVYVSKIKIGSSKKVYYGISNIGIRPTVGGHALFAETHIFDFSGNLYGSTVKVEFLKFIRDEIKFDGLDSLCRQVEKDILTAKEYLNTLTK